MSKRFDDDYVVQLQREIVSLKDMRTLQKEEIDHLAAEFARLAENLHDEMSQLEIVTDLANKRWIALNDIYENGEKHNANWCKRKAREGLGIK